MTAAENLKWYVKNKKTSQNDKSAEIIRTCWFTRSKNSKFSTFSLGMK
jgi:ABC-type multidrug transport system ATPase subunit